MKTNNSIYSSLPLFFQFEYCAVGSVRWGNKSSVRTSAHRTWIIWPRRDVSARYIATYMAEEDAFLFFCCFSNFTSKSEYFHVHETTTRRENSFLTAVLSSSSIDTIDTKKPQQPTHTNSIYLSVSFSMALHTHFALFQNSKYATIQVQFNGEGKSLRCAGNSLVSVLVFDRSQHKSVTVRAV